MTIMKYRPAVAHRTPFNGFVNDLFGRDIAQFFGSDDLPHSSPRANIVESDEAYRIDLLAPGFSKQHLKLAIENDTLTISGEKEREQLKEAERYTRREFGRTSFERSFRLPEAVNTDGITATFENGVLTITLPKTEAAKPRTREIAVQ